MFTELYLLNLTAKHAFIPKSIYTFIMYLITSNISQTSPYLIYRNMNAKQPQCNVHVFRDV